ncbi:hypothetical protein Tco_1055062 [Tanacetum coccineum]|uniref:Uncharacterized protein n=1 Tax=Tanacetum coccineum TaxID=301880 RepID=A0ABQ5GYI7_9ASTR
MHQVFGAAAGELMHLVLNSSMRTRRNTDEVDIESLTLDQYLALELNNTRKSFTHPENSSFKVKGQLLRELRKIPFSGEQTDNTIEHIRNILEIASILNAQESTLVQVFPLTLERIAKRWFKRTLLGIIVNRLKSGSYRVKSGRHS